MSKRTLIIIGLTLLGACVCIGLGVFTFISQYDFSANATTIEQTTRDFVQLLHEEEWEAAYALTGTPIQQTTSLEQFQQVTREQIGTAIEGYRELELCDWGVFNSDGQNYLQGSGLFTFGSQNTRVVFSSSLVKENNIWKIAGFQLLGDRDPTPFGRCALD